MPADMHTHSEHSHDSTCRIEEMLRAQKEKGTPIFAVTDHVDTASWQDYDVFTPIQKAHDTVAELNHRCGSPLLLSGVEISEGFWFPEVYEKLRTMTDYDVIIGSVHLVRFGELSYAYSKIDFSALSDETIAAYLDAYFDDILTLLDTIDFDILAHLTCPLRYIVGKYHRTVSLDAYREKLDRILRRIIEKNIALEVNTSGVTGEFGVLMPERDIVQEYLSLGGRYITLASDAHVPEHAAAGLAEGAGRRGGAQLDGLR